MRRLTWRDVWKYVFAALCVGSALSLKLALIRFAGLEPTPFLLTFVAVMVSAWYGGTGPGVLATILTVLANEFLFLEHSVDGAGPSLAVDLRLYLFVAEGILISLLGGMLRRSESRNAAVTRSAMDGIITIDHKGRVIEFNPSAEQIFGYTRAQAIGRELAGLVIPPELREAHRIGLRKCLETGKGPLLGQLIEMSALRADGSEIPVELSITKISSEGAPLFTGFVRDLSSRKEAEQQLAKEVQDARLWQQAQALSASTMPFEQALQQCLDMVRQIVGWPVGHVYLPDDADRRLVSSGIWSFNDPHAYLAMKTVIEATTYARDERLPGRIWSSGEPASHDYTDEEDQHPRAVLCRELGIQTEFGFPVRVGTSVVAVMELFAHTAQAPDPQQLLLARSVGDQLGRIIERRSVEQERALLASIVDLSNDAIVGRGIDGTITSWNAAAERTFGFPAAEALGQSMSMLLPPEQPEEEPALREAVETGLRFEQFDTWRRRKDGRVIPVSLTVSPIRDEVGRVTGTSIIARDITRRKEYEELLNRAKEDAEAANQVKSEFLANVSHEVRTPMNAVIGMLELSLGEKLPATVRDYLVTARNSAVMLLFLLHDILDFSRLEVGKFELDEAPFNLRETLAETMKTFAVPAREKGLEFDWHVQDDVPETLLGDDRRLRQILINLVSNALKFTEQGRIDVDVVTGENGDKPLVHFTVRDTGIGIAPEDRQRIFEPFTQVDQSATRRHSGTGLGLAICRELIERMDGRIWVESEPGKGSTFHFTAALAEAPAESAGPTAVRAPQVKSGERRGVPAASHVPSDMEHWPPAAHPLRVLLAEDTPANRKVATAILAKRGHEVEIAQNGAEAVELVQKNPYDVVLMDVQMPVLDGLQATAAIRQLAADERARVPIVAMTAHVMRVDRERCLAVGMDGYISKPVDAAKLIRVVERVARRAHAGGGDRIRDSVLDSALFGSVGSAEALLAAVDKAEQSSEPKSEVPPRGFFDRAAIIKRLGGNAKLLRDLMRFCEEDTPGLLADVRSGIEERDPERIIRAAHTLQGMAANFNAEAAMAAAMRMQLIGRSGKLDRAQAAYPDLEQEFAQLRAVLAQHHSS